MYVQSVDYVQTLINIYLIYGMFSVSLFTAARERPHGLNLIANSDFSDGI